MTDLTTGVVFLISSLYGGGQATNQVNSISANFPAPIESKMTSSSFKNSNDPLAMEAYLRKEFADTPILVDIARCESNFRQFDKDGIVIRGRVDRNDIGLLQINERYQGSTAKVLGMDIYTLEGNIAYAKHLYDEQGSKPWSASQPCWSKTDLARK